MHPCLLSDQLAPSTAKIASTTTSQTRVHPRVLSAGRVNTRFEQILVPVAPLKGWNSQVNVFRAKMLSPRTLAPKSAPLMSSNATGNALPIFVNHSKICTRPAALARACGRILRVMRANWRVLPVRLYVMRKPLPSKLNVTTIAIRKRLMMKNRGLAKPHELQLNWSGHSHVNCNQIAAGNRQLRATFLPSPHSL